jgi:predicted PurR-regulated permease PerM
MRNSKTKTNINLKQQYKEYSEINSRFNKDSIIISEDGITNKHYLLLDSSEETRFPQFIDTVTMEPTEEIVTQVPTMIITHYYDTTNDELLRYLITSFVVCFFCVFLFYSQRRLWNILKKPKTKYNSKITTHKHPMMLDEVELYQIYPYVKDDWHV